MDLTAQIKAVLIALAVGALAVCAVWLHRSGYDAGAAAVKAQDAKALVTQIAADNAKLEAVNHANDKELAQLQSYVTAVPVPPVRLCLNTSHPPAVPKAVSIARATSAPAGGVQQVPASNNPVRPGTSPGPNIGPLLGALAESADQVSAQLRSYQSLNK